MDSEVRRVGRGVAVLMAGRTISLVLSLVAVTILARMLGPEKFGIYSFVMGVAAVMSVLPTLTNQGMMRYAAQHTVAGQHGMAKDIVIKSGQFLAVISTLSLMFVLAVSSSLASSFYIVLVLPFVYLGFVSSFIITIFYTMRKMHFFVMDGVVKTLCLVLVIPVMVGWYGLAGGILAYDIAALVAVIVLGISLYFSFWRGVRREKAGQNIYNIFSFSFTNFLSAVLDSLSKRSGIFILTYFSFIYGLGEVGYFNLALTAVLAITSFIGAVPEASLPAILKFRDQNNNSMVQATVNSTLKYSLMLGVPVAILMMFFAEPLVSLIFSEEFSRAGLNMAILGIYMVNILVIKTFIGVLIAHHDTKYFFHASLVELILFIAISMLLIPLFASRGISLALALGSTAAATIYIWRASKHGVKLEFREVVRVQVADIKKIMSLVKAKV